MPWALHFGTEQRRIVMAGHSHVICILQSLGAKPRDHVSVAYNTVLREGPPLEDAYWEFVRDVTPNRLVAIMWNGNQHNALFLVRPTPPIVVWDAATVGHAEGDAIVVPRTMLADLWAPSFEQLGFALAMLAPIRRVVVLGTPPPKRQQLVRANLSRDPWFVDVARSFGVDVDELPVTSEHDRLLMWRILQDSLADIAASHGVPFIPVPPESVDEEGFLLADMSADDATHANAAYGDLICDLLEKVDSE